MISTVIFDIDGTLLDTEFAVLNSLQDTMIELTDKRPELSELAFALGIPGEVALLQLNIMDTKRGNAIWNNNFLKYAHTIKLFDGIENVIKDLKSQGYRLGIITSKTQTEYRSDFLPFGLADYFDTVVCADESARPKPFPDPVLKFLELSGTGKEEVIYIGDTAYDMQCADRAGIKSGLALWGLSFCNEY